ncbi:hypothetical protein DCAR_0310809 [Daucus carota subsp. sativus]|uniref:PWWP domain-containing protein n=1 Tax=Daucus carota subsp. sativus TaxID=79200 RepID=A0AAF1ATA0_DAUCS|nr:hypothetical protein DCAR_0310809 [Daucus carota subsp. sativus]
MGSICKENIEKKSTKEDADNHLSIDLTLGDVIWVKINKTSWWPAQVFNEDSMSCNFNPIKKADSDVLVRLYGSYRYLYVDPVVSRSEFACILLENNGKYDEIMMKTLKKDLARVKYGRSKGERAEPKGKLKSCDYIFTVTL